MNTDRAAWLKDRVRALAQGAVDNLEIIWQPWAEELTEEEYKLCCDEVKNIATRINRTRTFASREKNDGQQDNTL
jgi:hypothetical protein